jgi:hypothetical protein
MGLPGRAAGQTSGTPQRFTAFAVNMGTFGPTRTGTVEIVITRWSTEDEREMLLGALLDKGPDALLRRTPRDATRGLHSNTQQHRLRPPLCPKHSWRRRRTPRDPRHRPADQLLGGGESAAIEYPFTMIELRLNRDGEGEGKMSIATRITGNRELGLIELEDYAPASPVDERPQFANVVARIQDITR